MARNGPARAEYRHKVRAQRYADELNACQSSFAFDVTRSVYGTGFAVRQWRGGTIMGLVSKRPRGGPRKVHPADSDGFIHGERA